MGTREGDKEGRIKEFYKNVFIFFNHTRKALHAMICGEFGLSVINK